MTPFGGVLVGVLAGLITSGIGAYVALRKWRAEVRAIDAAAHQSEATAAVTLIDAARSLLEPYQEQINVLRSELKQIDSLRSELASVRSRIHMLSSNYDALLGHVSTLERLMRASNLTPPPRPPLGDNQ